MHDLIPAIDASWPEAIGNMHIDAWREVYHVDGYDVIITEKPNEQVSGNQLFFINLGGYKPGHFEELHYKLIIAAPDMGAAIRSAKGSDFYKEMGFKGAESHVDDKYGVDVDEAYAVKDILPGEMKERYAINLVANEQGVADEQHIGYFKRSGFN